MARISFDIADVGNGRAVWICGARQGRTGTSETGQAVHLLSTFRSDGQPDKGPAHPLGHYPSDGGNPLFTQSDPMPAGLSFRAYPVDAYTH